MKATVIETRDQAIGVRLAAAEGLTSRQHSAGRHAAEVAYYDPYVPVIKPSREYAHFAGKKSVEWNRFTIGNFDAVLIATNHSCVHYGELGQWARCILDTRNAMAGVPTTVGTIWKA